MLEIPIRVGVSKEQADKAFVDFANGARDSLNDIIGPGGYNLSVNLEFKSSGERTVESALAKVKTGAEKYEQAILKASRTQEGSITSLRQSVNSLKQQRDALAQTNPLWTQYSQKVQDAQSKLRAAQGVQVGSLADLRRQRDELTKLRDSVARFPSGPQMGGGSTWNDLNNQIKQIDGQINKVTPGFSNFFNVLGRIATVQAGFIAITTAVGALGGVVNAYVSRTKQVEAFNLALTNVGLTQTQVSLAFKDATNIANRLGAPVQQVEKSYQRMIPALRAVGATSQTSSKFIENITARTQTLGLNTEESGRLLEAFAQVLSKGKLQSEELNQQISELDGAFRTQLADALGVTVSQLTQLVETGQVTAPVFVDAINKMSNGVQELQNRIKNGTATIQQLQNLIANVNVKTLTDIGKQIEPAIKSFLKLSYNVSVFFNEFAKTEAFKLFVTIFNQTSKGIEVFITNLLKLISAINTLLTPIFKIANALLGWGDSFGGLIGILVNFIGALVLLKGAVAGVNIVTALTANFQKFIQVTQASSLAGTVVQLELFGTAAQGAVGKTNGFINVIKNLGIASVAIRDKLAVAALEFVGLGGAAEKFKTKGQGVADANKKLGQSYSYGSRGSAELINSLNNLDLSLENTGEKGEKAGKSFKAAGKDLIAGLLHPVTIALFVLPQLIELFNAGNEKAKETKQAYSGVFSTYEKELKRIKEQQNALPASNDKIIKSAGDTGQALKKQSDDVGTWGNVWRGVATAAGIAAIGLAGALLVVGTGGAAAVPLIAATAAAVGTFAATSQQANKDLDKSAFGKTLLENFQKADKQALSLDKRLQGLGVSAGKVDFSKLGKTNLVEAVRTSQARVAGIQEEIASLQKLLDTEKTKENQDKTAIAALEARIQAKQKELDLNQLTLDALEQEKTARINAGDQTAIQTASVKDLTKALEEQNNAIDAAAINARTEALKRYGQSQQQAGQLEIANIAIEQQASAARSAAAQKQLAELQRRRNVNKMLTSEEKARETELTKTVAEESLKQAEYSKQVGEAIVNAFEKGIEKAKAVTQVYQNIAASVKQGFDGIAGSIESSLGNARSLVSAAAQNAAFGLGDDAAAQQQKRQILQQELQTQAIINQAEYEINRLKLMVSAKIAENEARIIQLRMQGEAKIAELRGDQNLAQAYREAAAAQGQIISMQKDKLGLDLRSLDLQKQASDQALIQRGLQGGIASSAQAAANQIGVQYVGLGQARREAQGLVEDAKQLGQKYGEAATQSSNVSLEKAGQETQTAAREAENVKDAYRDAADSVSFMKTEMEATAQAAQQAANNISSAARILNGAERRALGGPVAAGNQYLVNDGGGREGFVNQFGKFSMLPAGRNLKWTAPTAGTVIPSQLVDRYRQTSELNKRLSNVQVSPSRTTSIDQAASGFDSGNLIQRVASAMVDSGSTQRITNNVTIQSQEPVMDASKIMTNVARMRLRNRRGL